MHRSFALLDESSRVFGLMQTLVDFLFEHLVFVFIFWLNKHLLFS